MHTARMSRCGMTLGILVLASGQVLASPDANDIAKKSQAAMNNLNSYQGIMAMNMSMGQMGSMVMDMDIKMKPKEGKTSVKTSMGKGTGMMGAQGAAANVTMVDDGKFAYTYIPAMGGYQKKPHVPNQTMNMSPTSMAFQRAGGGSFKYLRSENVGGKPAYVLQMVPGKGSAPQLAGSTMLIWIDQATYRFKQMTMTGAQQGQKMDMKMVVKSETVNAPIPDSAFKFTPPPGAKELKGGAFPGMGGPGAGGSRPVPPPPHK